MSREVKVLITLPNAALAASDFLRSGNVVHIPSLDAVPDRELLNALQLHGACALIASRRPPETLLRRWSRSSVGPKFLAYAVETPHASSFKEAGWAEFRLDGDGLDAIAGALANCERHLAFARWAGRSYTSPVGDRSRPVFMIGTGIVNLVAALFLTGEGYRVTVLDRAPAPGRTTWDAYGCTHAGDGARMFTFTEMDSYNNRDYHAHAPTHFRRTVERRGWLTEVGVDTGGAAAYCQRYYGITGAPTVMRSSTSGLSHDKADRTGHGPARHGGRQHRPERRTGHPAPETRPLRRPARQRIRELGVPPRIRGRRRRPEQ
jgi:hypothetical protein